MFKKLRTWMIEMNVCKMKQNIFIKLWLYLHFLYHILQFNYFQCEHIFFWCVYMNQKLILFFTEVSKNDSQKLWPLWKSNRIISIFQRFFVFQQIANLFDLMISIFKKAVHYILEIFNKLYIILVHYFQSVLFMYREKIDNFSEQFNSAR